MFAIQIRMIYKKSLKDSRENLTHKLRQKMWRLSINVKIQLASDDSDSQHENYWKSNNFRQRKKITRSIIFIRDVLKSEEKSLE